MECFIKGLDTSRNSQTLVSANFLPNIGNDIPQVLLPDGHDSHNFVELIEMSIGNKIKIVELPAHTLHYYMHYCVFLEFVVPLGTDLCIY